MRTFLMILVVAASLAACDSTVPSYSLLAAQDRPVCMGTEIDQACVDQQNQDRDVCVSNCEDGCVFSCEQACNGDQSCENQCGALGNCTFCFSQCPSPDPEDCRVEVVVDPEFSECASVGEVKICSKIVPDGLGTITYEYPFACNETLDSPWQCEQTCSFQNPQDDKLGSSTFFCPNEPEIPSWDEDCIIQNDGDVLMRP